MMEGIVSLFGTFYIQVIVWLLVVDVVLGIFGAIRRKEFLFSNLAMFMRGPVLAYILGLAVIELVAQALPSFAFIVPVAFVLVAVALVASIFRNLRKLGLPLPRERI